MSYNHQDIEKKWQKRWEDDQIYRTPDAIEEKFYSLGMFPYPSGDGLHIGHPKGYTANDIWARYKRSRGFQVLMPMGWDSFGLPAENYAIKTGVHPAQTTKKAIDNFRQQLKSIGLSYDWSREISTSDPSYYKWTQWIFLRLFEKGLAYQKEAPVNWCPGCQTVLANEQVKEGLCDRCSSKVVQKNLKQWFLKITDYAEELLEGLDDLDWPDSIKAMQKNWIGKSSGASVNFDVNESTSKIEIFTTRPDTLFGATYLVISPEHPFLKIHSAKLSSEVLDYIEQAKAKSELDRQAAKEKTGVDTGFEAIHPLTNKKIPIWVADYVLMGYGTGAIMAVPAHDERDWDFAQKYKLPIISVIEDPNDSDVISESDSESENKNVILGAVEGSYNQENNKPPALYTGHGRLINSGSWNNLHSETDLKTVLLNITNAGIGKEEVNYRLRDWLVSRQRYWGPPIPVIYCEKCGVRGVEDKDLPVQLPDDVDFKPTGESPLNDSETFHNVKCLACGGVARREVDTLDTFVDSSWYFIRYLDTNNESEICGAKHLKKWMPVDLYVGGAEHAVLHLLYARFITKALDDIVGLGVREPFRKLVNVGLIRAEDGQKMSKSRGNVVNPDEIVAEFGADSLRIYEMFMGPFEESVQWDPKALVGVRRWLDRVWNLSTKLKDFEDDPQVVKVVEQTIEKVTADIENFRFNTCISAMMIAANKLQEQTSISAELFARYLKILAPFAPHLAQELWERTGNIGYLDDVEWPVAELSEETEVTVIIQVDGKFRGKVTLLKDLEQSLVEERAKAVENVAKFLEGTAPKAIYVPGKLINFLTK
ncbi:leucine--tRNA ligase [Candidatus Berkelbacteria bacterium]|nr:leucine--tRNA ligase [Candidatus Berkelbacteria bacterium]